MSVAKPFPGMLNIFQSVQFTRENVENWLHPSMNCEKGFPKQIDVPVPIPNPIPKVPNNPPIMLSFPDLYDCFYYLKQGDLAYEIYLHKEYRERKNMIQQEKIIWLEVLKKEYKKYTLFKPNWTQIEHELSQLVETMSLPTFMILCFVFHFDLYLFHDSTRYYFHPDNTLPTTTTTTTTVFLHVAEQGGVLIDNKGYSTEQSWRVNRFYSKEKYSIYQPWKNWESKWKSISSYKKEDLLKLIQEYNIVIDTNTNEKLTKPNLYQKLIDYTKKNPFIPL
jgi:hypothetical protein